MADALTLHPQAFAQDAMPWLPARGALPGCRRLEGLRVVVVRHSAESVAAREAVAAQGWAWPQSTGDVTGNEPAGRMLIARRHPEELLLLGPPATELDTLAASLAAGRASDAVAIDLTHGMSVVALEGSRLDEWLAHLVDASAIPRDAGRATRARLVDIAVLLLRLAPERLWLVVDRAFSPYLANWLAFAHEGAFGAAP